MTTSIKTSIKILFIIILYLLASFLTSEASEAYSIDDILKQGYTAYDAFDNKGKYAGIFLLKVSKNGSINHYYDCRDISNGESICKLKSVKDLEKYELEKIN